MKDKPKNVAQSVRDRLKVAASRLKLDYNLILIRYVLERLMVRLSASRHKDRFALKGAMLFVAWTEDVIRPTRDLDLLGFGDSEIEAIRSTFADILETRVPDDGVVFDMNALPFLEKLRSCIVLYKLFVQNPTLSRFAAEAASLYF